MRETVYAPVTPTRVATGTSAGPRTGLHADIASAVATTGLALGVAADTLFRDGIGSVAFAIWIALLALSLTALVWRSGRQLPRESALWLVSAIVFASCLSWRNSALLQFFDVVATLGCLGLAIIRLRDAHAGILADRMRETVGAGIRAMWDAAVGIFPLVLRELVAPAQPTRVASRARTSARLVLIATAIVLVFGSLLRGADPIFASIATVPALDVSNIVGHVLTIVFAGAFVAVWWRSALLDGTPTTALPAGFGFSLGAAEVTTILGTLNALFAAFVVTQLSWFFGGEAFLRARTGLTAAQYARGGFFQMLWIIALVVPVLVVTRVALREERGLARRHTLLALPIIGLLGTMIACSMARLNLYVNIYGVTTDRLYPLVFMGWLFATLLWLSVTVLRDWHRPFAVGVVLSAMSTLLTLNALDLDAFVARVNVARATHPLRRDAEQLDVAYLAELSGGAVPYAVRAVLGAPAVTPDASAKRCTAARRLLDRFGPARAYRGGGAADVDASWRFWNFDNALATQAVTRHFAELLAVRHAECAVVHSNSLARRP